MSIESKLEDIDQYIRDLNEDGAQLIAGIEAENPSKEVHFNELGSVGGAAYDFLENKFHYDILFAGFYKLFNAKSHEGVHCLQFNSAASIVETYRQMMQGNDESMFLSVNSVLKLREISEIKANAVQAYFTTLATRKYNDRGFLKGAFAGDLTEAAAEHMVELVESGKNPKEIGQRIAREFLNLPCEISDETQEYGLRTIRDLYHTISLAGYVNTLKKIGEEKHISGFRELTSEEIEKLVKAGPSLGMEQEIIDTYCDSNFSHNLVPYNESLKRELQASLDMRLVG